jgi:hypothetical protein
MNEIHSVYITRVFIYMAELKSLINFMPDGSVVYPSAKDKQELIAGAA